MFREYIFRFYWEVNYMNQSIKQIKAHILPLSYENWLSTLVKSNESRPQYHIDEGTLYIGQVVARFLGVPLDEDEYYNRLYDLINQDIPDVILISREHLDKTIHNEQFQAVQRVLNMNREQKLSVNRFTAFLDGEQLLIKSSHPAVHRKIREAMILFLQLFAEKEEEGLKSPDLQRVLVDVIKWSFNHLADLMMAVTPELTMPKFLWYGNVRKSHEYFLAFLYYLGCDLILFNPEGADPLSLLDKEQRLTYVHKYPEQHTQKPFPTEKRTRKSTVAYRASQEIEALLNQEGSGLYKPWQLRDYTPSSITLKTTYDEIFLLAKEKALIRPNFEVRNGVVKIPALFAKIQGVSRNRREYWDHLHALTELENSVVIQEFPLTRSINNDFRFHFRHALGQDGQLSPLKMLEGNYWRYRELPLGLQHGIASAIQNICIKPRLKALQHEKEEEVKIYLFTHGMQIPSQIVRMMQKFDYAQEVPKLILYHNGINGILSRSDAALLLLLNQFGFDIVIYNPAGQSDIENYVHTDIFDTHWLEDLVFEQEYKEPSPLKKFTFSGFLKNLRGEQ